MIVNEKASDVVRAIAMKRKIISIGVSFYLLALVLYDFLVFKRETKAIIITYTALLFIGIFIWFGIRLIFYVQIKNERCPKRFYNLIAICALVVFGIGAIVLGVEYFFEGFLTAAFIAPIAFLAVLSAQFVRRNA